MKDRTEYFKEYRSRPEVIQRMKEYHKNHYSIKRRRAYYLKHRNEACAYTRNYYKTHKDAHRLYAKEYRKTHRDEIKIKKKEYAEANKDSIRRYKSVWRNQNPDKVRKYFYEFYIRHPEKQKEYHDKFRKTPKGKAFRKKYYHGIKFRYYRKFRKDECERCGSNKTLCVHHRDGNPRNNTTSNLITLCRLCHLKAHNKCSYRKEGIKTPKHRNNTCLARLKRNASNGRKTIIRRTLNNMKN